jgi:uncharacterized protein (DUF1778 family)
MKNAMQPHYVKTTRNTNITIRSYPQERDFIDNAAKIVGKTRSDFMLEASTQKAEEIVLNQRNFFPDENTWKEFVALLDNPPEPSEALKKLLLTPAPWEK